MGGFTDYEHEGHKESWDDVVVRAYRRTDAPACAVLLAEREGWDHDHATGW